MTGIALGLEIPTIVKTYKTLGKKKGNKQLLKSTAIAGAGVAGYVAGSAAHGAAVGSVVPVAGTAVGAVVGLVGGLLGAWGADTLARKVLPSELEMAAKDKAKKAAENPEELKQLLKETEKKAADETDPVVLEELNNSCSNLAVGLTDDIQPEQADEKNTTVKQEITSDEENEVVDVPVQTQKRTRNKSKLLETLNWFKQMLARIYDTVPIYNSYYNRYNNQYNSYETPFYQMRSQYGYMV